VIILPLIAAVAGGSYDKRCFIVFSFFLGLFGGPGITNLIYIASGPFLVSRTGDAGSSGR